MIISVLIAFIVFAALVSLIIIVRGFIGKKNKNYRSSSDRIRKRGSSNVIREAEKKLSRDPHNINALETLGEVYYTEKNWEKAWTIYKTLHDIAPSHVEIDIVKCTLRMGIAAFNLEKYEDAAKSFMVSLKRDPENFEANVYLGKSFNKLENYDKAIFCFKKARMVNPEDNEVNALLGISFFNFQKYREALPFLKRVIDEDPNNKEVLFDLAVSMSECGMGDKALKIFVHLRPDPLYGPQSCLEAGKMHERSKDFASAIKDYEIGLKLQYVPEQILFQIKYRLASTYIAMNDISNALIYLKQIQNAKSGYKDVDILVDRYSELNQNKNLQTYLLSGTSDFVALCRKIILSYYKDSFVKVEDVQVASECVEIICSVENSKWEAKQMFRFYRNQNALGDIYVREFHSKLRDAKCDGGFCMTMGSFSESAHKYTEGRPIDLIEKEELVKILKRINMMG